MPMTRRLVSWLTTSQFTSSHEGTSGHPQVQVTVASAYQPEYSQLGRTSAQMMCWMWVHWTDPERLWQAFSTLCPCCTSMPTSHSQIRRPFSRSFRRNNIHPRGIPATFIPIPAGNPQIPRDSPAICIPVHTSSRNQSSFLSSCSRLPSIHPWGGDGRRRQQEAIALGVASCE